MKVLPLKNISLAILTCFSSLCLADPNYQIGSEWGKKPVNPATLSEQSPVCQNTALATARFGGATSFYLGKVNGRHIMATNHHVLNAPSRCNGVVVSFPLLGVQAPCVQTLGTWSQIDLALFVIEVRSEDEAKLATTKLRFAFHGNIVPMQELLTIGFGVADNPRHQLMANQDSDCKVFSRQNDFRWMGDPDDFNPANYKAWSFAIGCEGSHGDSGSAIVDRNTGEAVGIIWTGKTPKAERIQHSDYLEKIFREQSEEIWTELAYAVPASKIFQVLRIELSAGRIDRRAVATLQALLAQ